MKLRERIADFISGGELARAARWQDNFYIVVRKLDKQHEINGENLVRLSKARSALRSIDACETPKASSTVRKMAAIARGEL